MKRTPACTGFTLVELMVAMVIGMAIVLALMTVTARYEAGKRQNGASNDLALNMGFVAADMDRLIRSAGSGYVHSYSLTLGCTLNVSLNGAQLLPGVSAFPAPFDSVPKSQRLVPVLIYAGLGAGGTDVLAIKSGMSGVGETAILTKPGAATSTQLNLVSTAGLRENDLLLMVQNTAQERRPCLLTQVATGFKPSAGSTLLPLGGSYYAPVVNSVAVADFDGPDLNLMNLGNASAPDGNAPQMLLYGIGANNTLFSYDLLQTSGSVSAVPQADGVVDMRALYGIDTNGDGNVDTWVKPTDAGYTAASLSDGTAQAQQKLTQIRALRVGLIMRSDRVEKTPVSPTVLNLFTDLGSGLAYPRPLTDSERLQRLRVVEFTVPLRNVLLLPRPLPVPTQDTP
ncbi:MAG TPA: PilW family protein [Burkholderiaceae bacterium]|jgi:type IV pilus assembly protein PilW